MEHAFAALEQARALAPELPETLTAAGYYHYWGHLDYKLAIAAFDRALQKEPRNYLALRGKAYALRRLGRMGEAVVLLETTVSLDPLFAEIHADLGYCLLRAGQYQQAKIIMDRATLLGADNPFYQYINAESFLFRGELEPAWQAMLSVFSDDEYTQGFYLDIQMLVALAQDDASRIDFVLDRYGVADSQSLGPIFTRGLVYHHRDEPDKLLTLIEEFQQSLQIAQRERPDSEATLLGFVHLYGLQKDQARLTEAVKAYYAGVKPDALRIVENRSIPIAYALAGDTDGVLAYLDELVAQYGPWEFYYFTIDPVFDSIRNLPRFQALDKQYRQWLEQQS